MKQKLLKRCLLGAPIGLSISYVISIVISLFLKDGTLHPVVPEFSALCGGELKATVIQALVSLLYGAIFAGASVIWENEKWSLARQTLTHLAVISLSTLPIAWFTHWMHHSLLGVILYFAVFFFIYFIIWIALYLSIRKKIKQLDEKVKGLK